MADIQTSESVSESKVPNKLSLVDAARSTMKNRFVFIALIAAIIGACSFLIDSNSADILFQTSAAAFILIISGLVQNIVLIKKGNTQAMRVDNRKSLDVRLVAGLNDISGLGSTIAVLAAVAMLFSDIYIIDGGIFSRENFAAPLVGALARSISLGSVIAAFTSKESINCSIYIILARAFGLEGAALTKKSLKLAHSIEAMKKIRNMLILRISALMGISLAVVMTSLSGVGACVSSDQTAIVYVLVLILAEAVSKANSMNFNDDKQTLWMKGQKGLCVWNTVFFLIITFAFIYTYPFHCVYSEEPVTVHSYSYTDAAPDDTIDIISRPSAASAEDAVLFNGYMFTVMLLVIVMFASTVTDRNDLIKSFPEPSKYKGCLIAVFIAAAAVLVMGVLYPERWLSYEQLLVPFSVACFMVVADLLRILISGRKSQAA